MHAQLLTAARRPLVALELPAPRPGPRQLLIAVRACAVCRTDLHIVDGELADPKLPLVIDPVLSYSTYLGGSGGDSGGGIKG